jgi:hypothetical protein
VNQTFYILLRSTNDDLPFDDRQSATLSLESSTANNDRRRATLKLLMNKKNGGGDEAAGAEKKGRANKCCSKGGHRGRKKSDALRKAMDINVLKEEHVSFFLDFLIKKQ